MTDLSSTVKEPEHWVRLNHRCGSDLLWWDLFLKYWNGVELCRGIVPHPPVATNVTGRWGCSTFTDGVVVSVSLWESIHITEWDSIHITGMELLAIVVACMGKAMAGVHSVMSV